MVSLLAFTDVDSIVVCVNTETAMTAGNAGIPMAMAAGSAARRSSSTTRCRRCSVTSLMTTTAATCCIRPATQGPRTSSSASAGYSRRGNSPGFFSGLWAAVSGAAPASQPAILSQSQTVQKNAWFGVPPGTQPMTIVWVYLNYASDWTDLFAGNDAVQKLIASEVSTNGFPHYDTRRRRRATRSRISRRDRWSTRI